MSSRGMTFRNCLSLLLLASSMSSSVAEEARACPSQTKQCLKSDGDQDSLVTLQLGVATTKSSKAKLNVFDSVKQKVKADPQFWFQSSFPQPGYYLDEPFIQGPTQIDDLGLLFGVIKELRPATLVEIGAFNGDSAKIFMSAMDDDATLFSFDPFPQAGVHLLQQQVSPKKYRFNPKDGGLLNATDLDNRRVDFAFIDASHVFASNQKIWKALVPHLSDTAVVAIHDTGFWSKKYLDEHGAGASWRPSSLLGKDGKQYYLHPNHVDERRFVNWIVDAYPNYETMHFHTLRYLRNGVTLVQQKYKLETPNASKPLAVVSDVKTISDGCNHFKGSTLICGIEKPEHKLVRDFIPSDATVLELGARFGTTTCEIAKKLENSGNLVAVEPDPSVWAELQQNLASNNCKAHVMQGVVSDKKTFLPNPTNTFYNLRSSTQASGVRVPNLSLDEVQDQLALKFDTLLIDCEGCLPQLMAHLGPKIQTQIKLILLEGDMPVGAKDCTDNCVDYAKFATLLHQNGFQMIARFNDCDKAHYGGDQATWCGNWIWHYAFRRDQNSQPYTQMYTVGAGSDFDESHAGDGQANKRDGEAYLLATNMHKTDGHAYKGEGDAQASKRDGEAYLLETNMHKTDGQAYEGAGKGQGSFAQYEMRNSGGEDHELAKHLTFAQVHGSRQVDQDSRIYTAASGVHLSSVPYTTGPSAFVEVVASHFDEDLSWISLHSSPRVQFTVYSKSPTPPVNSLPLPNVGREGHTYLYHIVKNYDNLAAWTVFTQAVRPTWGYHGPGQQSGHLSDNVLFDDYLVPFPNGEDSFFVFDCVSQYPSGMALMRMGFLLHDLKPDALQKNICLARGASGWSPWWFDDAHKARLHAATGISQWYHTYIAQDADNGLPLTLAFAQSGRFAVSRARIHLRPRQYYEALLQQLSTSSNPIEGYWLEASWYDIFHPEKLQSIHPACAFPSPPADISSAISVVELNSAVRAIATKDGILKSDSTP